MKLSPDTLTGGRRTRRKVHAGLKAKTLKRMLKAKGKKTKAPAKTRLTEIAAEVTEKLGLQSLRQRNWYIQVLPRLCCALARGC